MIPSNELVESTFTTTKPRRLSLDGNDAREQALLLLRELEGTAPKRTVEKARAKFLSDSEWFMRKCVEWFKGDDVDEEDLMQTATAAFWIACVDWEPGRAPLLTFARWRVRTALRSVLRCSRIVRGASRDVVQLDTGDGYVDEVA